MLVQPVQSLVLAIMDWAQLETSGPGELRLGVANRSG